MTYILVKIQSLEVLDRLDNGLKIIKFNKCNDFLLDEKFVSWLIAKLSSYPALCHQLCFEIKEAHINHHLARLNIVFSQLAKLGVSWSIEKFGSPEEEQPLQRRNEGR